MAIWIDPPRWPAHGTVWSHLISDRSHHELHEFATQAGLPRRGFDADHYDVPGGRIPALIAAGARATTSKDLLRRLADAGLRVPKRKGERLLATEPVELTGGPGRRELIASRVETSAPVSYLLLRTDSHLMVAADGTIPIARAVGELPTAAPVGYERLRPLRAGRGWPVRGFLGAHACPQTSAPTQTPPPTHALAPGAHWLPLGQARQRWGGESWWRLVDGLGA
jgi:hypothetical protein